MRGTITSSRTEGPQGNKFWNWAQEQSADEGRTLYLDGVIAEESWFDDDITPALFRGDLEAGDGEAAREAICVHNRSLERHIAKAIEKLDQERCRPGMPGPV